MSITEETLSTPIILTNLAANAEREIMTEKNLQGYSLRLYISGGGCSGYQYGLALDNRLRPEDTVIETDGVKLIIDEVSIKYLQGATVDFVAGNEASGFKITNPNPIAACSCNQNPEGDDGAANTCSGCG